jgi:non-homologous end joining protein Ku
MQLIDAKLEGQEIAVAAPQPAKVTDLMSALKASVAAAKKRQGKDEEEEESAEEREPRRRKAAAG